MFAARKSLTFLGRTVFVKYLADDVAFINETMAQFSRNSEDFNPTKVIHIVGTENVENYTVSKRGRCLVFYYRPVIPLAKYLFCTICFNIGL